jgi:hypothetical protein
VDFAWTPTPASGAPLDAPQKAPSAPVAAGVSTAPSILILTPVYSGVPLDFLNMALGIVVGGIQRGVSVGFRGEQSSNVLEARNALANLFLSSPYSHAFWIDADMSIPPEALFRMLGCGVDYVAACGAVRRRASNPRPAIAPMPLCTVDPSQPVVNGMIETPGAQVSCALIHRRVFERLIASGEAPKVGRRCHNGTAIVVAEAHDFFSMLTVAVPGETNPRLLGEDHSFCVRCQRAGIVQRVLVDVDVEHAGETMNLAEDLARYRQHVSPAAPAQAQACT